MVQFGEHILDTKTEDFDRAYVEDRYRTVLAGSARPLHLLVRVDCPFAPALVNFLTMRFPISSVRANEACVRFRVLRKLQKNATRTTPPVLDPELTCAAQNFRSAN